MVFCDHVIDTAGSPDIWITEDLDQDPEDMAPASIRVVWQANRWNVATVMVDAVSVDRIQDGCKAGQTPAIPDSVPDDHLEEMKAQIHLHLAHEMREYGRDQEVKFRKFDEVLNVEFSEEPNE